MIRRPPGATRTDTLLPHTALFRSAQEQAGGGGQIEKGAERTVELARVAPWEVHSRGARFRGKHRIAHERGVTNEIGQTIVGVTGRRDRTRFELADGEGVSIGESPIELAAVGGELRLHPDQTLAALLHLGDTETARNIPPRFDC